MFEETFEVTEMRTFKHEPFFYCWGRRGGGAYSWYFTVVHNPYTSGKAVTCCYPDMVDIEIRHLYISCLMISHPAKRILGHFDQRLYTETMIFNV